MDQDKSSVVSDKVGITSAVLCTVHCLAVPVFFILKGWYANEAVAYSLPSWWDRLDTIFLIVSFIAVYHSSTHTKIKEIKIALWICWSILALSLMFEPNLHWLAYIASAGLIITHFINIRLVSRSFYKRRAEEIT